MKQLYSWQDKANETFKDAKAFLLEAACGTGKTLAAIKIALAKMLPVIVITPGHTLCDQWKNELIENGVDENDIWVYSKPEETKHEKEYKAAFEGWLNG